MTVHAMARDLPNHTADADLRLPALLAGRDLFSRAEAMRLGIDDRSLQRAVRSGALTKIRRGWYTTLRGLSADARYLLVARAAAADHDAPLTGLSGLVVHGLPVWGTAGAAVFLERSVPGRTGGDGVTLVRPLGEPSRAPVAPVLECLLVAALFDPELALAAADAATRAGLVTPAELHESLGRLGARPGARPARVALALVDPRRESVGESRLAYRCHLWQIELEPQVRIDTDRGTFYLDFRVKGRRLGVQFDGMLKYAKSQDLRREKNREDAIRREGYGLARVVWEDFSRGDAL